MRSKENIGVGKQLLSKGTRSGMLFRILLNIHDDFQLALGLLFRAETDYSPWALSILIGPFTLQVSGTIDATMAYNSEFLDAEDQEGDEYGDI
jgi:hypothetical protein